MECQYAALKTKGLRQLRAVWRDVGRRQYAALKTKGLRPALLSRPKKKCPSVCSPENKGIETTQTVELLSLGNVSMQP